jgi:predicted aldo/keto reductase-like oxidoreductase
LKTDYIDILYVHSVASVDDLNDEGLLEAMTELKKQGKIRAAGVSTHEAMATVINGVAEGGFYDVVLTSINVAMASNTELLNAIANAAKKKVGIVAMKTQAGGARLPNPESLSNYSSSIIATASLKWVMRNENIATSIPGFDNYQHMQEDFSVADNLEYSDDEQEFLSDNSITLGFGFCHQCRQCVAHCPHNVDVPALMRTHMYAAQYSNFHEARSTLDDIAPRRGLTNCTNCKECSIACANSVNIKRRVEELKLIFA